MANSVTFEYDATRLLAALDFLTEAVRLPTLEACRVTAEAIATEARARAARRGPNPTKAQQGRPPIEELIRVEAMHNGTGYVVIVQEVDETAAYLPFYLERGGPHVFPVIGKRPFFFVSATLEQPAHQQRINDAAQAGVDAASGLGG